MNNRIHNVFKQLKEIHPDAAYSSMAKRLILAAPRQTKREIFTAQSMSARPYALSLINTASLVAVVGLLAIGAYVATTQLSPLLLPGLNQKKIVAEADAINQTISIQLAQLERFKKTNEETATVLANVSSQQLNHLNDTIIANEAEKITQIEDRQTTQQINKDIKDILDAMHSQ